MIATTCELPVSALPPGPAPHASYVRRALTAAITLTMIASPVLLSAPSSPQAHASDPSHTALYSDGIAQEVGALPTLVTAGSRAHYLAGSRVLDPGSRHPAALAGAEALATSSRAWLDTGTVPGKGGPYEDMVTGALLDMHALEMHDGASVAAWSESWRYVWPRDASFVAVAMATTGHIDEALEILSFLRDVEHPDGSFEARYLPDGSGPPDHRGVQSDGSGWVLWATHAVLADIDDPGAKARAAMLLRPMIDRSTHHILVLTAGRGTLPAASSDFWEERESVVTLGTAAPLLSGLEAAADLYRDLGARSAAARAAGRAASLRAAIVRAFGPRFGRYPGGASRDAADAFLLPPFQPTPVRGALAAWRASADEMARPAGGLSPGGGWREDSISWTPPTALYGLTAAWAGDATASRTWLTWIDKHRTASGAIPEKVLADGSPAAAAPLAWSAACVVLAVARLDQGL